MTEKPPSIWTMDRPAIEQTLVEGRSPRGAYSDRELVAVRTVIDRPDFDHLDLHGRQLAFKEAWTGPSDFHPAAATQQGSSLTGAGWCLILMSVAFCLFAFFGYTMTASYSDTLNIGLLQNQLMLFLLGLAGLLSGVAALLTNCIVAAIRSPKADA
ncbi:hypothetical protein [Sphingomonas sp.]|uniref:hypothetical protein n=1 Tax=Sphingomonas sp. TaxID=28214 RepID=UPI003CC5E188